ncbi:hypothetical protein TNCV_3874741 [Trichonephila clavipes]|nr:hypothetical protein TNCV_3874741 [Trichonephila clavipes]
MAQPLLRMILEDKFLRAVPFRSIFTMTEFSVWNNWRVNEFQSTVQQIYRWKEEDFRVVKIEAELILEANRLQLMKQNLEKRRMLIEQSLYFEEASKTLPSATAAVMRISNGKNDYQKKRAY